MRPARQWRIHQAPIRVLDREVHLGAGVVHVGDEAAQPERQLFPAPHRGKRCDRHVETGGVLLDRVGEQRMRSQLAEHSVPVLERGLYRRRESHRVPQVFHPVLAGERRSLARIPQRCGVIRNFRRRRIDLGQYLEQLVQDGIDLRCM